jgi:molybdopterin-guanine dinucleotide biosynthesis protein A
LKTGQRKIDKWYSNCSTNQIDFSDDKEMFININDQNELKKYENIAI